MNKQKKFVKVLFGDESHFGNKVFKYKIGEVNIAENWNPENREDIGGFSISTYNSIARWIVRGDTLYDVVLPDDVEIIEIDHHATPHGVFRVNKLILENPRQITDEFALELFLKSEMPEKTYFKTIAGYAIRGHVNAASEIIKQKINKENIDLAISEYMDFCKPIPGNPTTGSSECSKEILDMLLKIKEEFNE